MLHFLIGVALCVGIVWALTNDDVRYLLGQLVKIVLGLAGLAVCIGFIALVVLSRIH